MNQTDILLTEALKAYFSGEKTDPDFISAEHSSADAVGALFRAAEAQHVLPLVYTAVSGCDAVRADPGFASCKRSVIAKSALQMQKEEEFLRLYTALCEMGLRPLVVKGTLCRSTYPDGYLRASADEDLLVSDGEYDAVTAYLTENGFSDDGNGEGFRRGALFIEVHKTLFESGDEAFERLNGQFSDVHEFPVTYALPCGTVYSMSAEKHLLFLILHAYKHFIHSGFGLRQVCDVGLWADKYKDEIDFSSLYAACADTHTLKFAKAVFMLAEELTGRNVGLTPEWDAVVTDPSPMLDDMLEGGVFGSSSLSRLHSAGITLGAAKAGKKQSKLRVLFPPKEKLIRSYPELEAHPERLPLVWIKRIVKYRKETKERSDSDTAESLRIASKRTKLLKYYDVI